MAVEEHSEEEGFIMTTTSACGRYGAFPAGEGSPSDREGEDDELTSLSWLQDTNLLKNYGGMEAELSDSAPSSDAFVDEPLRSEGVEEVGERHLPYNPRLHSGAKPPFSFSCLIFMAIEDSLQKALPVKDIYGWILSRFPYFQNAPTGWKNSVRHNLSLSKCFRKVDKDKGQNVGKGSLWCIDPAFRPNLLQALQKAPSMANVEFSHFSCISPSYFHKGKPDSDVKPCLLVSSQQNLKIPSPELFPFLSRHLASSMKDPEVDAAATMLTLKNGTSRNSQNLSEESESDSVSSVPIYPCKRLRYKRCGGVSKRVKGCVMTNSPSEDHTYSACNGDAAPPALPSTDNALMNLAEIATRRLLLRNS